MNIWVFLFFFKISLEISLRFQRTYEFEFKDDMIYNNLLNNYIGTEICLGESDSQCLMLNIETKDYEFWVISSNSKHNVNQKTFNQAKSDTFYLKNTSPSFFSLSKIKKCHQSYDTLIINSRDKLKFKDFLFLLVEEFEHLPVNSGILGLGVHPQKLDVTLGISFIVQLRKNKIIPSYSFAFIYDTNNDQENSYKKLESGQLIIGEYPSDYISELDKKGLKIQYEKILYNQMNEMMWGLDFDKVEVGNNFEIINDTQAYISIESGYILGPSIYEKRIKEVFFSKWNKMNRCFYDLAESTYSVYYCDSDINLTEFPDLVFKKGNYNITLTHKDLFVNYKNKKIFLVAFPIHYNMFFGLEWRLGAPFLKAVPTIFDLDKKVVGFYVDAKLIKMSFIEIMIIFFKVVIIGIILGASLFGAVFIFGKYRKKRILKSKKNIYYNKMQG